ncbi:hypothetical protein WICPIJ_003667 [Wickerhamomyces pijperi]|uniref:Phosphatidylinositol N-acetylglucosaminyltransferase subunit H conserved domain-containing protein n=1 Tax=Wickerhamomyces pijperi TaxID=599730 RepID=A0A9P8Q6R7_WICPI|nr:hypothetical protein WICPIJ_003667 [Wickerhamomyces pijperi]
MNRPANLVKLYDDDDILDYRYIHSNTMACVLKSVLLLVSMILIYQIVINGMTLNYLPLNLSQKHTFLVTVTVTVLINRLITINKVEYVTVIPNVGIQLKQTSGLFITTQNQLDFIPSSQVIDVVINEGFKGLLVVYYLAIMVRDRTKLSIVLPGAKVTIDDYITIRKDMRSKLSKLAT